MKRSTFFKSLIAVIAAPKILSEIKWAKPKITKLTVPTSTFYKDLQFVEPYYYKEYVDKYGGEDFTWWLDQYNKTGNLYYRGKDSELIPAAGEPVTITITKENHGGIESI